MRKRLEFGVGYMLKEPSNLLTPTWNSPRIGKSIEVSTNITSCFHSKVLIPCE